MRRFAALFGFLVLNAVVLTMSACGGGGTPKANVVDKITLPISSFSLNKGDVVQISATAQDKTGAAVLAQFTYSSSNTSVADVSTSGLLCGGKWDDETKPIVCTPSATVGTATITVSSQGVSTTAPAYVHEKVDLVKVIAPSSCSSMADTVQLAAKAYSTNAAVCGSNPTPCELPPSSLGQFTWSTNDADVVTIDNATDKSGTATAGIPGQTTIYASLNTNNSPAVPFTTCPVTSLSIAATTDNTTAPFSFDKAGTKGLTAVAIDSKGKTLTAPPLTWVSSQTYSVSITPGSPALTATVTGVNPGTSYIQAVCDPSICNRNLPPVFSNMMKATTNGTPTYTVYTTSKNSTALVLIDPTTNTPTTTSITLPFAPNSMVINRQGSRVIMGSDSGAMLVDLNAGTATKLGFIGTAIGFSPDGSVLALHDTVNSIIYVLDANKLTLITAIPATGSHFLGDFTVDGHYGFFAGGTNKLYGYDGNGTRQAVTLSAPAYDTAVLASGQAVYLAGGAGNAVPVRSTCNIGTSTVDTQAANAPKFVEALPDGTGAVAVDSPNIIVMNNVNVNNACPPTLSEGSATVDLGQGSFTATQLLVTPDSKKAIVFTDSNKVFLFDLGTHATTVVSVGAAGTKAFPGGTTLDSTFLWVASSDGKVHKIDLSNGNDAAQVDPALKKSDSTATTPDFVVIRNK